MFLSSGLQFTWHNRTARGRLVFGLSSIGTKECWHNGVLATRRLRAAVFDDLQHGQALGQCFQEVGERTLERIDKLLAVHTQCGGQLCCEIHTEWLSLLFGVWCECHANLASIDAAAALECKRMTDTHTAHNGHGR